MLTFNAYCQCLLSMLTVNAYCQCLLSMLTVNASPQQPVNSLRMFTAMIIMMFGVATCQAACYCKLISNFHGSCIGELHAFGDVLCTTQDGTTLNVFKSKYNPTVDIWFKRNDPGTGAWEVFMLNKPGSVAPGFI